MVYKFNPGDKVYIVEGPDLNYCPNPSRIGEEATIEGQSPIPNFYFLEEFPGLWPAAFLLPITEEV